MEHTAGRLGCINHAANRNRRCVDHTRNRMGCVNHIRSRNRGCTNHHGSRMECVDHHSYRNRGCIQAPQEQEQEQDDKPRGWALEQDQKPLDQAQEWDQEWRTATAAQQRGPQGPRTILMPPVRPMQQPSPRSQEIVLGPILAGLFCHRCEVLLDPNADKQA